jgi:hypothetical protein
MIAVLTAGATLFVEAEFRWGRDEKDRAARHRRHTTALKRAMERQSKKWPAAQHGVIARIAEGVIEDW